MLSTVKFSSERNLVDSFVGLLAANCTPWGEVRFAREFNYFRGKTDVLALQDSGALIAIEAKLTDWKCALHQAYRNTCFAHHSFVLLPKTTAMNALRCVAEFQDRGVGLCYIDGAELVVLQDSPHADPIEPWLASEAISRLDVQ